MLRGFSTRFTDVLIEKGISNKEDREIIIYGFYAGTMLLINVMTIIILGALLGMFLDSVLLLISFSLIRTYAGGYHHESPVACYFMSTGVIIFELVVLKYLPLEYITIAIMIISIVSIPVILKLAPLSTEERPLDESEKKYFRKKVVTNLGIESVLLLVLVVAGFKHYSLLISLGIFLSAILLVADKLLVFLKSTKYTS